ncbi:MAG: ATP synthase subunit I [Clostridiales bacterium]|nr:ATP synthase subunit I [Clostridiales bacterium]
MEDARKTVFHETAIIAVGEVIGVAVMLAVFALLGRLDRTVVLGGIIGGLLAVGNFLMMAINVSLAADKAAKQDVKAGKAMVSTSYVTRMVVLFVILFACVKSGLCNVIACVVPLLFVRVTITVAEFMRKSGDKPS